MIAAVVFCPQAPVVVPDLAQGAAPELDDLREASRLAIRQAVGPGVKPVLVGAGQSAAAHESTARGTLAGFGLPLELGLGTDTETDTDTAQPTLPASLTVGAWLVRDALGPESGTVAVEVTDEHNALPAFDETDVALVVLGDGSARRTEKAPGHFDERAAGFDDAVAAALAAGDPAGLRRDRLAAAGGEELLVSGLAAWDAVARVTAGVAWAADLLYAAAPYGVGYFVAHWTRRA